MDFILMQAGNVETIVRVAPRFIINESGAYIVEVELDEDGDIKELRNITDAFVKFAAVTPKRLEKLVEQFMEASKTIVSPTNGAG